MLVKQTACRTSPAPLAHPKNGSLSHPLRLTKSSWSSLTTPSPTNWCGCHAQPPLREGRTNVPWLTTLHVRSFDLDGTVDDCVGSDGGSDGKVRPPPEPIHRAMARQIILQTWASWGYDYDVIGGLSSWTPMSAFHVIGLAGDRASTCT